MLLGPSSRPISLGFSPGPNALALRQDPIILGLGFLNIIICVINIIIFIIIESINIKNSTICIIINKFEKILLVLSLINLKNTIITIEEKSSFFMRLKNIRI
jgi:hypothetical protein